MRRRIAVLGMVSLLTLSACGGSGAGGDAEGKTYQWDMTITVGNTSTWYAGAEEFARALEEKSNGRMKLNLFPNEQLSGGDPAGGIEMLQKGEKAFSYNSTIIYAGLDQRFGAVNAPFLYNSYKQWDDSKPSAEQAYAKLTDDMNIKFLGFGESGMRQLTNNSREVRTPADMSGLKIRVPGMTQLQDAFKELGANPTTMNFSEVFTALQQRTIDGQENPVDVTHSSGITEVQKYQTMWNYVYDPLILGMSEDLWNELSDNDKKIVEEAAKQANAFQIKTNREKESRVLEEQKSKMTITELSESDLKVFQEAMKPVYSKYEARWTPEVYNAVKPKD